MQTFILNANGLKAIKLFKDQAVADKYIQRLEMSLNSSLGFNVEKNIKESEGFIGRRTGSRKYEATLVNGNSDDLTAIKVQFYCDSSPCNEPYEIYVSATNLKSDVDSRLEVIKQELKSYKSRCSYTVQESSFWAIISYKYGEDRDDRIELSRIKL